MSRSPQELMATRVIKWLQKLKVSEGPLAGEPFKLMEFQRKFIYGVMGHHESALSIARGNGKTTLTAALAAAAVAGPLAAPRAQTIVVAASLGQARLAFGHTKWFLKPIIAKNPKRWRVIEHSHECRIEDRETGAMMRAIGSDPRRAHGLAPVLLIADEPAQWPVNAATKMYAALVTALGKHSMSRFIAIGTRPDDSQHWFSRMLQGRQRGMYGQMHAAGDLGSDFSARSIADANPALKRMPALAEAIEREKHLAMRGGPALHRWRAYRLNRGTPEVGDREKIVTLDEWNACVYEPRDLPPATGPVAIGFDLGGTASMCAFSVYWPETGRFEVKGAFGAIPNLRDRGMKDDVGDRYTSMNDRKELRVYPGRVTNVAAFLTHMARRLDGHEVIGAVADAYRKGEAEQALAEGGIEWEVEWRRVGAGKDGSADIRAFQAEVLDGHLKTSASLLMESAIFEANIGHDTNGNPRLDKSRDHGRIDALQAAVLAVGTGRRWRLPSPDHTITRDSVDDFMLTAL